jgi:hypothetical protein
MSKGRDYFDGLEMEGISKILEKQRAVQITAPTSKSQPRKQSSGPEPVRLADYIRANSGDKQDYPHSPVKKFISSISNGLSSSNEKNTLVYRVDQYKEKLAELSAFVKKNLNNEENYHHFEGLLENVKKLAEETYRSPETTLLDTSRTISTTYLNIQ